jgi:hypothetical protein
MVSHESLLRIAKNNDESLKQFRSHDINSPKRSAETSTAKSLEISQHCAAPLPSSFSSSIPSRFSSRFISLDDICKRINRSRSWAYENGIVPVFNVDGTKKQNKKRPPFPWIELPHPHINLGKRGWLETSIDLWLSAIAEGDTRATRVAVACGIEGKS